VKDEQNNAPELPIGRFLKSKSLGGNRVILVVPSLMRLTGNRMRLMKKRKLRSQNHLT
jgi:hypothetical protein